MGFKIIRTVMRSLFKRPVTTKYPSEPIIYDENVRGHISITSGDCILCGICSKKCPTDAIEVDKTERQWTIHRMQCVQCGHCVEVCPKKCLHMEYTYTAPDVSKTVDTVNIPERKKPAENQKDAPNDDTRD